MESDENDISSKEKKEIYRAVAKAQLQAWKKGSGYFYWSYKLLTDTVNETGWKGWDSWDFGRCVDFHWFPGIPVYHSKDLKNWELYTHVLTDDEEVDLKKLPSAKGIWAPCLTYCESEDLFYVIYGVMNSMNARYFDVDNFLITAKDIKGPWSKPVYLHSSGFDASILHDDDGRKWIVSLEWETRANYEKPGYISAVEYDPVNQQIKGNPQKIWTGGTDRGCIEAPHLTKRGEYYYIMCAEGGTGYYHSVTMGRAKSVLGPYESDPMNPILTSSPGEFYERKDWDHLKERYFKPESYLQKSGHGSYVETPTGETWLVYLCARPFRPELRCTLGRETAIQRMEWTTDGWLRMRGQESRASLNKVSILARKLTTVYADVTTKMEFHPEIHQHSAGLILYYDNMNYINLRKYYSESLNSPAISINWLENGEKHELGDTKAAVSDGAVYLKVSLRGRKIQFSWGV